MRFNVSSRGQVTADTLCQFDKILVPDDAFVTQRATVSNYQFNLPSRSSKEDLCQTRLQWHCGAERGTEPFVLFPNSASHCH